MISQDAHCAVSWLSHPFLPNELRLYSVTVQCTLALPWSTGASLCSLEPAKRGLPSVSKQKTNTKAFNSQAGLPMLLEPTMLPVEQCAVCGDDATSNKFVPHFRTLGNIFI